MQEREITLNEYIEKLKQLTQEYGDNIRVLEQYDGKIDNADDPEYSEILNAVLVAQS